MPSSCSRQPGACDSSTGRLLTAAGHRARCGPDAGPSWVATLTSDVPVARRRRGREPERRDRGQRSGQHGLGRRVPALPRRRLERPVVAVVAASCTSAPQLERRVRDRRRPARPRPAGARSSSCSSSPLAPLCRDDCAGLCPTCGVDRNADALPMRRRRSPTPAGPRSTRFAPGLEAGRLRPGRRPERQVVAARVGSPIRSSLGPIAPCAAVEASHARSRDAWPFPRRRSRSRRRAAIGLARGSCHAPARSLCPRCGNAKLPHTVCPSCGWYKNRVAVDVGDLDRV